MDVNETITDERFQRELERVGWALDGPPRWQVAIRNAAENARHAVMGCKPVPLRAWQGDIGKLVEVGTICPVCQQEFPL